MIGYGSKSFINGPETLKTRAPVALRATQALQLHPPRALAAQTSRFIAVQHSFQVALELRFVVEAQSDFPQLYTEKALRNQVKKKGSTPFRTPRSSGGLLPAVFLS